MSALYLADLPLGQYKNQIAKSNVANGEVLEEEAKIFFITAFSANHSQPSLSFINLNGEGQSFSPRYWTRDTTHFLIIPFCGRRFEFNRITSYHGFYLSSGGSL